MDNDISEISPLFHITRESAVGLKLISANIIGVRGSMLLVHRTRGEMFCQFLCSFPTIIFSFKDYLKKIYPFKSLLKTQYVLIKKLKTAPNAEYQFPSHTPPKSLINIKEDSLFTRWGQQRDIIEVRERPCWVVNNLNLRIWNSEVQTLRFDVNESLNQQW